MYVRLLEEGTEVFRPVKVSPVGDEVYRIDEHEIPDDEQWEFQPGQIVRLSRIRTKSGSDILVVS